MSEPINPLDILKESHASGRGFSYWSQFHGCPYHRVLDKRQADYAAESQRDDEYITLGSKPGKPNMRNVGVLFHKLCEFYYTDQLSKVTWEYAGEDDPLDWQVATKLFRAYRDKFPVDEFGAVYAAEEGFHFGCEKDEMSSVEVQDRRACFEEFGVPEYSGRIDLLPMILEPNLDKIRELRPGLPILYPGVYILDHKTKGRRNEFVGKVYQDSIQMQLYMHAWDLLHPDQPCQGAIISMAIPREPTKREPNRVPGDFESFLIPKPTAESLDQMCVYMRTAYGLRETYGRARANRNECWRYEFNPCSHHPLMGGVCNLKGE
jgi:hypothetical protein